MKVFTSNQQRDHRESIDMFTESGIEATRFLAIPEQRDLGEDLAYLSTRELLAHGLTVQQIVERTGMPEDIVQQMYNVSGYRAQIMSERGLNLLHGRLYSAMHSARNGKQYEALNNHIASFVTHVQEYGAWSAMEKYVDTKNKRATLKFSFTHEEGLSVRQYSTFGTPLVLKSAELFTPEWEGIFHEYAGQIAENRRYNPVTRRIALGVFYAQYAVGTVLRKFSKTLAMDEQVAAVEERVAAGREHMKG